MSMCIFLSKLLMIFFVNTNPHILHSCLYYTYNSLRIDIVSLRPLQCNKPWDQNVTLDVSGCFSLTRRSTWKGNRDLHIQKVTGSLVCNIIPRALSVKYLLQRPLCLILFQRFFFQIKSTAVASSHPLNSVLNRVQDTNGLWKRLA